MAFEGGEGSGKSTQAALLAARLDAVLTREPGGTEVGGRIRELVLGLDVADLDPRAEALLMAADRAQHVAEIVRPALEAGRHVVTDRYIGSSLAYQGIGRGLGLDEIRRISAWATGGLVPDVVVFLEVSGPVAAARTGAPRDRMEGAGADFHQRVADGFRRLAADDGGWVTVAGEGTVDEVAARVWDAVSARLTSE